MNRRQFLSGVSAISLLAGINAQASITLTGAGSGIDSLPPIAVSGVTANASLNFTVDNAVVSQNSTTTTTTPAGIYPPSTAFNTPSTASNGWYIAGFFYIPNNFQFFSQTETIACSAASYSATAGGGNDRAVWIRQTNEASNPSVLYCTVNASGNALINSGPLAISRGKGYFICFGQTATNTFFCSLIDVLGNVISNASYTISGSINSSSVISSLGCANMASNTGHNPLGFSGCIQNWGMAWGVIPNSSGVPTLSNLIAMAVGAQSFKGFVSAQSHTLRYFCTFAGPSGLAADAAGAVTGTATAPSVWTQTVTPIIGDPICPQPWLTLQPEGDNGYYVWGVNPGATTGEVWFRGSYATSNGTIPTFEGQLTRIDNATVYVAWTPLLGVTTTPTGSGTGTYQGYIIATAGVGFSRAIRYAGQSTTICAAYEKHGVGIVPLFHAQSQTAYYFDITSQLGSSTTQGASSAIQPVDSANTFACVLAPVDGLSDTEPAVPNQTNGPNNDVYAVRPLTSSSYNYPNPNGWPGAVGDAIVAFTNKLMSITGYPVMVLNGARSGTAPQNFYADRQNIVQSGSSGNGWVPNGSTTAFIVTLGAPSTTTWAAYGKPNILGGNYGLTTTYNNGVGGTNPPMILPGSFIATIAGISVTDDGAGNLVGSGISGTINYTGTSGSTYPSINITFTSAPLGGSTYSASWTSRLAYAGGSNIAQPIPNEYSTAGIKNSAHTGQISDLYLALGSNIVTVVLHPWWTNWLPAYSGGGPSLTAFSTYIPNFDGLKWFHRQWPAALNAKFGFAPAHRDLPSGPTSGGSEIVAGANYGAHRYLCYAYAAGNTADTFLLADNPDVSIAANNGPHQEAWGGQMSGQRHAYAVAAALGLGGMAVYSGSGGQAAYTPGIGPPVMGPLLTSVVRTSSSVLTLTFALPNGTSLNTYAAGGIGSTLAGFEVGQSSVSQTAAWSARSITGFTAAIASATTVTITLTSGSWLTYVSLNYCTGYNVFTGTSNYANDNTTLKTLLCDNAGGYTLPTAGGLGVAPSGNAAAAVLDWAA